MPENRSDYLGVIFSVACILHCLALPLVASIIPSMTMFLEQEWVHKLLLLLLVPVAMVAFVNGKKTHHNNFPIAIGGSGILFLICAIMFEGMALEKVLTVIGSCLLVGAHVYNVFLSRKADHPAY